MIEPSDKKYVALSNGVQMPSLVMSTNWMDYKEMKAVVLAGLQCGFRAFDTARDYHNEHIVGRVIQECLKETGVSREEIFITTKIGNGQQAQGNIAEQMEMSLRNLRTDYVDLWLMHWPYPNYYIDTWHKMEKVYATGKAKAIGMANYRVRHFRHLFEAGVEVNPHCVQFEFHPMRTSDELVAYCREHHIAIQAYSPLCRMIDPIRQSEILNHLAKKYGKTLAQIILRWHYQQGIVPVFKSTKPARIRENFNIFDFALTDEEIKDISSLDEDYKFHLESASCPGF